MKIILTGASSPIGSKLFEHYKSKHTVIPVSRSYSYDLNNPKHQKKLIKLTNEADIFLNVAHINYLQGMLLDKSNAKINISFSSLITKFSWQEMQKFNNAQYISEKLFLEYVHRSKKNSALINISNYGNGDMPSVTDEQIIYAVDDVISGNAILPKTYELSHGLGSNL